MAVPDAAEIQVACRHQRRRAVEAGRGYRAETSAAARNRRAPPPSAVHVARPPPPAARIAPPPPPPRMAAPPPRMVAPPPRMAAPSPPPPRMAAPPPRVAAPAAAPDGCAPAAPGSAASGGSQEMPAECRRDADCLTADRTGCGRTGPKSPGNEGAKNRPYFLASGWNPAIYRAISHGNMAQKAVRWQPGHKARLLTRFRRNQPEN